MDHIKQHVAADNSDESYASFCRYCLKMCSNEAALNEHLLSMHPTQTKDSRGIIKCIICRVCIDISFVAICIGCFFHFG